jgi:hypothetical protein
MLGKTNTSNTKSSTIVGMRPLFTDGFNSMWHLVFGLLAYRYGIITPIFLLYQFVLKYDHNSWIDVGEFVIGYLVAFFLVHIKDGSR